MAGERTRTLQAWSFCWSNGVQGCHTKLRVWSYLFGFTCDAARCHSSIFFISLIISQFWSLISRWNRIINTMAEPIRTHRNLSVHPYPISLPWPKRQVAEKLLGSSCPQLSWEAGIGADNRKWRQQQLLLYRKGFQRHVSEKNWKGFGECTLAVLEHLKQEDVSSRFHDGFP